MRHPRRLFILLVFGNLVKKKRPCLQDPPESLKTYSTRMLISRTPYLTHMPATRTHEIRNVKLLSFFSFFYAPRRATACFLHSRSKTDLTIL